MSRQTLTIVIAALVLIVVLAFIIRPGMWGGMHRGMLGGATSNTSSPAPSVQQPATPAPVTPTPTTPTPAP